VSMEKGPCFSSNPKSTHPTRGIFSPLGGSNPRYPPSRITMTPKSGRSILRREALGFAFLIVCVWIAEFIHVPHLLFGEPAVVSWTRALARTALILLIWGGVYATTRQLVRRLHELEEFLRMCSWCRRLEHEARWLTVEEFFNSRLATETSHGICPDCAQKQFPGKSAAKQVPPAA